MGVLIVIMCQDNTILFRIEHENIIKLLGQSTDGENVCLVYELMRGGNLKEAIAKASLR